jgi:hypothetical protein
MIHTIQFALLIMFLLVGGAADAADDTAPASAALRGDGHVALIRHAPAPGPVGDPFDYKLDDCTTQRNLKRTRPREGAGSRRTLPHAAGEDRQGRQLPVVAAPGRPPN